MIILYCWESQNFWEHKRNLFCLWVLVTWGAFRDCVCKDNGMLLWFCPLLQKCSQHMWVTILALFQHDFSLLLICQFQQEMVISMIHCRFLCSVQIHVWKVVSIVLMFLLWIMLNRNIGALLRVIGYQGMIITWLKDLPS